MTLQINFDTADQGKLLKHIKWLAEIGLVKSYVLKETAEAQQESTDDFIANMIEAGEKDFANGNVYTHEEVKQKLKEWQANKK